MYMCLPTHGICNLTRGRSLNRLYYRPIYLFYFEQGQTRNCSKHQLYCTKKYVILLNHTLLRVVIAQKGHLLAKRATAKTTFVLVLILYILCLYVTVMGVGLQKPTTHQEQLI